MRSQKARETAWTGMLFALAIALSYLESFVSPLLGLMPAIKLGLSNIVVMYALLFLRTRTALLLVVLKALFAFLTRGATAGFLSLCGGALSLAVMLVLLQLPVSGYIFCAGSALAHNLGQLAGAAVLLSSAMALGYAPVLLAAGLIVGGFLGNFGERLLFGSVVDMLYFPWLPWFICNGADIAICFGVAMLVISTLFRPQDWRELGEDHSAAGGK